MNVLNLSVSLKITQRYTEARSFLREQLPNARRALGAEDTVHCHGVHSCKGQADCATTENACKGQNDCKGHGFKAMKAGDCLAKGGTIGDLG